MDNPRFLFQILRGVASVSLGFVASAHAQSVAGPMVVQWQKEYGGWYYDEGTLIRPTADGYMLMGTDGFGPFGYTDLWVSRLDANGDAVWQGFLGGSNHDFGWGLVTYPDGSSISVAYSFSSASGNKTNAAIGTWLIKLGPDGGKLWEAGAGGTEPRFATTKSGGALIGTSVPGATFSVNGPGGEIVRGRYVDASVSKQAPDGSYLWTTNHHYWFTNQVKDIRETRDGGIVVAGNARTEESFWRYDYFLMRLDSQGQYLWSANYGGTSNENLRVVRETVDGGFLLGGESFSPADKSKTSASFGNSDCWIVKVDSQGIKQWDKTYGGSGEEQLWDIELLPDGGFIAAATSDSTNGNKTAPAFGGLDGWLIRCDASGNKIWEQTIGGDNLDRIISFTQTPDGGFIAGIDTFSGVSGNKTTPNLGYSDFWIVKFAPETPVLRWNRCCVSNNFSEWSLVLQGISNVTYRVEVSSNLTTCISIQTNRMSSSQAELLREPISTGTNPLLFYRAGILP